MKRRREKNKNKARINNKWHKEKIKERKTKNKKQINKEVDGKRIWINERTKNEIWTGKNKNRIKVKKNKKSKEIWEKEKRRLQEGKEEILKTSIEEVWFGLGFVL